MWYQLEIDVCLPNEVDNLSAILEESGAVSITLSDKNDDPVLEPLPGATPLWPEITLKALYSEEKVADEALQHINQLFPHFHARVTLLPEQNWERAWMDNFKPQQFGERLWVCPSWITPPKPEAINLILDPGLAFGTGTHPTTQLCLTWLARADLANKIVIDYGCGSGILALAALKLGANQVQAVDIDPQALQATKANAEVNNLADEQLSITSPDELTGSADILIANILLTPLLALKAQFKQLIRDQGMLVISGILNEQTVSLIDMYQDDFIHQQTETLEDWSLLVFTHRKNK
ncbi:ribosomal protein L11 methyltransferase [Legionella beliardensis]|uniref:Ribosomal protein L11 methyltransferase n=1 Tax=Legionella beliardensis TaxID=91822 RepID=A0A378I042_9GAMM|nr:50S ribosomal protein L11 methyltransferase [Legionella beliardensis]STX28015.1 ribosomal protein L11 methyltransferase [Legionella beliardensis]